MRSLLFFECLTLLLCFAVVDEVALFSSSASVGIDSVDSIDFASTKIRKDFPETWIFDSINDGFVLSIYVSISVGRISCSASGISI